MPGFRSANSRGFKDVFRIDGFNAAVHDLGEAEKHLATQRPPPEAT